MPDSIAWGRAVGPEFKARIIAMGNVLGCDPSHLMAVICFESAGTFRSSRRNPISGAIGLIQFMPATAARLGTTSAALAAMTELEQLEYVERYFRPYVGRLGSLEDVYMAVLYPRAIGKTLDWVLFSKPARAYEQNRKLDVDRDGYVTKAEATSFVQRRLNKGYAPGNFG